MQYTIARDTLSKCIGDVSAAMDAILQVDDKRRERMNKFMQFVLQEDYNVIAFEKVLVNFGLQELLDFKTSEVEKKDSEVTQGIGNSALLIFLKTTSIYFVYVQFSI